jgi:hypothetical protein
MRIGTPTDFRRGRNPATFPFPIEGFARKSILCETESHLLNLQPTFISVTRNHVALPASRQ